MKNDGLKLVIHHPLDDFPGRFEQTSPAISASTLWDKDRDDPPQLGGDTSFVPNHLHKFDEGAPLIACDRVDTLQLLSSCFIPCSHSFRCSVLIWDAPTLWPLETSDMAV